MPKVFPLDFGTKDLVDHGPVIVEESLQVRDKLISLITYIILTNQSISLVIRKTPSLGDTIVNISFCAPDLPAGWHVLPSVWHHWKQPLPCCHQPPCLLSSEHCRLCIVHNCLVQQHPPVHSTTRFQVSTGSSWLQTLVATSSKGPFGFDQADSVHVAESVDAPAVVTTAAASVIAFNLKDDYNWLAVFGCLSFPV